MRSIIPLAFFVFSSPALAWWNNGDTEFRYGDTFEDACNNAKNILMPSSPTKPFYFQIYSSSHDYCGLRLRYWEGIEDPAMPSDGFPDNTIFNYVYSDSLCQSLYGEESTSTGVPEDGSGSACALPPTTDEQCLALNDDYGDDMMMILDFDPGELEWEGTGSGAGCMFKSDAGVAVEVGGKWHVPFYATGAAEDISGSTDPIDATGPEPAEGGELASSDDYTPTTDPQTDCQFSNVTLGGETYCYTGEYAPQDSSYPDGSIRVDNPDGSYDIVEPDGTTTEYTADGSIKTPSSAPDTAGGEDYGEGESGIIKAISGLKNSVENGFDKLVDKFTGKADEIVDELTEEAPEGDSLIADSNLDELSDQVDQEAEEHTDNVTEKLDEIGEDDSSPIADQVTGNFPDLPSSSCTPLTFGQAPFEFTISCDVFDRIRTWFGWIIYFWTVVSIMDTFFAPVSRRA